MPLPSLWAEYVTTHLAPNTNPITFSGEEVNAPRGPSPLQQFIAYFRNYEQIGVKFLVVSATIANHSMPTRLGMRLVFADRVAIIYRLPHPRPFYQSESDLCKVRAVNDVVADVDCTAPGTILRREMYFPGWAATAAGRSLSIQRADSIFQAVHVPAGQSTVRFDYQPPYSNAGLVAGGAGLVLLVGLIGTALVAGVRTRRRKAGRIISRSP
ncbi:MAG: hypothetical protein ACLQNU_02645 [Candidatus Dormibacteria bacterium]